MPMFDETCVDCNVTTERLLKKYSPRTQPCPKCGGKTERAWSAPQFHDFYRMTGTTPVGGYVTNNISRDGKPMEIHSHAQLMKACKENGVTPAFGKENRIG